MSDHALALWGVLGTVAFGLASLVIGWLALVKKSLAWGSSTELISTRPGKGDLSITYEGRHFSDVCISRLAVWNQGRGSMAGTEISKADPLRVGLSDGAEILSASVIGHTGDGVAPSVLIAPSNKATLLVTFDIMNEGDGFTLRILHHGSTLTPALFGTIRDVPRFREISISNDPFVMPRRIVIMAGIVGGSFAWIIIALWTLWLTGIDTYFASVRNAFSTLGLGVGVLGMTFVIASTGKAVPGKLLRSFSDARQ